MEDTARVYVSAAGRAGPRGEEGDEALRRLLESARARAAHHHGRWWNGRWMVPWPAGLKTCWERFAAWDPSVCVGSVAGWASTSRGRLSLNPTGLSPRNVKILGFLGPLTVVLWDQPMLCLTTSLHKYDLFGLGPYYFSIRLAPHVNDLENCDKITLF